jgi:hypothetical protein
VDHIEDGNLPLPAARPSNSTVLSGERAQDPPLFGSTKGDFEIQGLGTMRTLPAALLAGAAALSCLAPAAAWSPAVLFAPKGLSFVASRHAPAAQRPGAKSPAHLSIVPRIVNGEERSGAAGRRWRPEREPWWSSGRAGLVGGRASQRPCVPLSGERGGEALEPRQDPYRYLTSRVRRSASRGAVAPPHGGWPHGREYFGVHGRDGGQDGDGGPRDCPRGADLEVRPTP